MIGRNGVFQWWLAKSNGGLGNDRSAKQGGDAVTIVSFDEKLRSKHPNMNLGQLSLRERIFRRNLSKPANLGKPAATSVLMIAVLLLGASTMTAQEVTHSTATAPEDAKTQTTAMVTPTSTKMTGPTKMTGHWESCRFGGDGPVDITDSTVRLGFGDPLTGVFWTGEHPTTNYRLTYQAKRVDGFDFFAAVTFPVGDEFVTFVPGGWGGGVTGLSNIDQNDASSNETTQYLPLETGKWYSFTVTVTDDRIVCAVGDSEIVDLPREGRTFSLRAEMDLCKPFGLAAFQSVAEIRRIELQHLDAVRGSDAATDQSGDSEIKADPSRR